MLVNYHRLEVTFESTLTPSQTKQLHYLAKEVLKKRII